MTQCAEFAGRSWATCTRGVEGCLCGMDRPERVAHILEAHNRWRRGDDESAKPIDPRVIGLAMEAAVAMLRAAAEIGKAMK